MLLLGMHAGQYTVSNTMSAFELILSPDMQTVTVQ